MSDLPEPTLEEIQKQALDALNSIKDSDCTHPMESNLSGEKFSCHECFFQPWETIC